MKRFTVISAAALLALPACAGSVQSGGQQPSGQTSGQMPVPMGNMPLKFTARPTVPAITAADLMSRLYVFADDSMGGRQVGTEYNLKGAAYIAKELQRLGVKPAGVGGTYYQDIPVYARVMDVAASTITVDGRTLRAPADFVAINGSNATRSYEVAFGGRALDTMNVPAAGTFAGKLVMMYPSKVVFTSNAQVSAFTSSDGYKRYQAALAGNAGVITISDSATIPTFAINQAIKGQTRLRPATPPTTTPPAQNPSLYVSPAIASALLGTPVASAARGAAGKTITVTTAFKEENRPGRNVIGVIEGSDPVLKAQYVAIGAHNDHVGFTTPVEHDSLRAFLTYFQKGGAESTGFIPDSLRTPAMWAQMNAMKDSLRRAHGGIRMDSIQNGADDDGSGSMAVLEIAEKFATSATKPKRSILVLWYTGEEMGMWGSGYFVDNPTVPREQIVAALNVDMIGRGAAEDLDNAGPHYMQLLGSRRLSTEYGDLVETVNRETNAGWQFDYQYDADGHPQQFYCRSDHWSFARWGIPVTFMSTGGHRDYHQRTDEPQYINYPQYVRVAQFIYDVADRVANLDHKVAIDKPVGDPHRPCRQ